MYCVFPDKTRERKKQEIIARRNVRKLIEKTFQIQKFPKIIIKITIKLMRQTTMGGGILGLEQSKASFRISTLDRNLYMCQAQLQLRYCIPYLLQVPE